MKKFKERSGPRLGTINFDSNSYPILNPTHHPVVVFYVNNEVWYLNSETYKGIIHDGTILIKDPNGYENLVDTTAINIMDRKEF
ncbi:Mbov_0400 family ICE element protein, partial [Mycoplasma zalophidermidis]